MNNEERSIILTMLSEGKISPSEASDLLDAIEVKKESEPQESGSWHAEARRERKHDAHARRTEIYPAGRVRDRGLMIHVSDGDETRTKVHIPLGMALAAGKFLPQKAKEYFDKYGINLDEVLESAMSDMGRRGEIVDVRDGDTRVQIVVT